MGKNQAFMLPTHGNGKALEVGAWCLISSTFLYLSGVIHLIGRCLIGEVLRYICIVIKNQCPENVISVTKIAMNAVQRPRNLAGC